MTRGFHTPSFWTSYWRIGLNERPVDVVCIDSDKKNCAIKLGGVYCDGYNENALIGALSHFHGDHMRRMEYCLGKYDVLLTHPITYGAIRALNSGLHLREQWITQDYDTAYRMQGGGVIRLLKSSHIPGSAQIHVESQDGKTMTYSGDFGYPDVQVRESEYLVLDSNHGAPSYDGKTDRKSVKNRMFEHIESRLEVSPHVAVMVSPGTLQELVRHFEIGYGNMMNEDVAFAMDKVQMSILHKIYPEEHKRHDFRHIVEYRTQEFWNLIRLGKKCVIFLTNLNHNILDSGIENIYRIMVDRYPSFEEEPIVSIGNGCRFNLAAHASIDGIYDYIESMRPKYVVTDNSRSGYAKQLAKLIRQKFDGIRTEYRPAYD